MTRAKTIKLITALLTVLAFAGSYMHGVEWVADHWSTPIDLRTSTNPWPYIIAALPEIVIILCILKGMDDARDRRVWIFGSAAVAWTMWTNGAAAGGGASGMVVALAPAVVALMALFLQNHKPAPEPVVTVTQVRPTRPMTQRTPRVVLADQPAPKRVTARTDDGGDLLAKGVEWVKAQPDYATNLPSRPAIVAATGISDSTAKRVRAAVRKEIGQ